MAAGADAKAFQGGLRAEWHFDADTAATIASPCIFNENLTKFLRFKCENCRKHAAQVADRYKYIFGGCECGSANFCAIQLMEHICKLLQNV